MKTIPCETLSRLTAQQAMERYLAGIGGKGNTTRRLHRGAIEKFLDVMSDPAPLQAKSMTLSASRLQRWMIEDFRGRTPQDACVRLGIVRRYLKMLAKCGLAGAGLLATVKRRLNSRSIREMVRIIQAGRVEASARQGSEKLHTVDTSVAQRIADDLLLTCTTQSRSNWHSFHRTLHTFVTELSPLPESLERQVMINTRRLLDWMIADCRGRTIPVARSRLAVLRRYLQSLVATALLQHNWMEEFKSRHGNLPWDRLIPALQADVPEKSLRKLETAVPVTGPLAAGLQPYLELHRSLGKQYNNPRRVLKDLDRYLREQKVKSVAAVTPIWIESWTSRMTGCSPLTQRSKLRIAARFFDHLQRLGSMPQNPVTPLLSNASSLGRSKFRAFIFSSQQIAAILDKARKIQATGYCRIKSMTCFTMLVLLAGLGLRHREVRFLRVRDVNWDRQALWVERTKFYKDRYVPFGPNVGRCLREFLEVRSHVLPPLRPEDPLFVTLWRRPIDHHFLLNAFHRVVDSLGITAVRRRWPRLHDLRHTFAVHRLLRWYREGADVQSKLLLLATFMGHVEPRSTEVYLTITGELLEVAGTRFFQHFGRLINKEVLP